MSSTARVGQRGIQRWLLLAAALPMLLGGCMTAISAEDLDRDLRAAGDRVRGLKNARVFPLHADTKMEAMTMLADARTDPRARRSLELAMQIALAKSRHVHLIVGGPYADLNRQVVWNAFSYHDGKALPGLVIVYASPDPPDAELVALAKRKRAQLIHSPLL